MDGGGERREKRGAAANGAGFSEAASVCERESGEGGGCKGAEGGKKRGEKREERCSSKRRLCNGRGGRGREGERKRSREQASEGARKGGREAGR